MQKRKWVHYMSKFTLLDEVLALLYWALAIYGLFILSDYISSTLVVTIFLGIYIILVVVIYIFVLKKITTFFKNKKE